MQSLKSGNCCGNLNSCVSIVKRKTHTKPSHWTDHIKACELHITKNMVCFLEM